MMSTMRPYRHTKTKYTKGNDTYKDSFYFPKASTVAVQCEDGGPWIHGIVEEMKGTDHLMQSTLTRCFIFRQKGISFFVS